MLFPTEKDYMTPEQFKRWHEALDNLRALEERHRATDDPWLFHGTTALRAGWILRDGFRPSHLLFGDAEAPREPGTPLGGNGVHWGTVNVAEWAAGKHISYDDPPVILAVRLSDLRRAGELVPDYYALDAGCSHGGSGRPYDHWEVADEDWTSTPDWRQSLAQTGCIGVLGCRQVQGMQVIHPLRGLPVHPEWADRRQERLADTASWTVQPPPGLEEDTPETCPPTLTREEALGWHPDSIHARFKATFEARAAEDAAPAL